MRLGRYFGNDPQFWLNLQTQYDRAGRLESDERLLGRIEQARRSLRAGRGVKLEDVR